MLRHLLRMVSFKGKVEGCVNYFIWELLVLCFGLSDTKLSGLIWVSLNMLSNSDQYSSVCVYGGGGGGVGGGKGQFFDSINW